ncbi:MAG: ribosome maturation factor RimM [Spirochaetes bacterium]|nr:ribosome maturation factor RimM [Spirochaetota bacterium]
MERLAVGVVRTAHGTAGEVRVRSYSGEADHLLRLAEVVLRRGGAERTLKVEACRTALPDVLVKFAGIDHREAAQALAGWELCVDRSRAAPLADGEYYATDLCGCGLFVGAERVGVVTAVCETGHAQLLEVRTGDGRTVMVPFKDHFVGEVDVAAGRVELRDAEVLR